MPGSEAQQSPAVAAVKEKDSALSPVHETSTTATAKRPTALQPAVVSQVLFGGL